MLYIRSIILSSLLLLTACSTTVLTDEERTAPVDSAPFGGKAVQIDAARSFIAFTGKSNIISHQGRFKNFGATFTTDSKDAADLTKASLKITVLVTSVETADEQLTQHLLQDDFFAAATYPEASFVSKSIKSLGNDIYMIIGDLTIKGVTKPVFLEAVITNDSMHLRSDVRRKDFGVGNDSYGDKILSNIVPVEANLAFQR